MRVRVALCFWMIVAGAVPVSAQEPKPDMSKAADIQRLLDLMGVKKMMSTALPAMFQQMRSQMETMLPKSETQRAREISNFIQQRTQEEVLKIDLEGMSAAMYAKHFTQEEIRGMIQFYESPVGRKLMEKTPIIMQESMAESMGRTQSMMKKIFQEVKEKFPELKDIPIPPAM